MQILKVETASSIDVLGKPVATVLQFRPGETVFVCVKLDYLISGNSIKAVWKNEAKEILNEEEINIDETYYSQTYKWFSTTLEPGSKFINPGNYEVEVFLNDDLFDSITFEVLEKEPVTFNNGIKYSNEEFNFSIAIPDGWSYQEQKEKDLAAITLSPGEDIPATFKFSVTTALPIQPYDEFTKADADNFAQQHGWVFADSKSRDYNLQNKYPTREIMYLYQDEKGANYVLAYSITEYNDNAYIYNIVVEDQSYGELVQSVYSGILNSLQIQ